MKNNIPAQLNNAIQGEYAVQNSDATNIVDIYTAGANQDDEAHIDSLFATNDSSTAVQIFLFIRSQSGNYHCIGQWMAAPRVTTPFNQPVASSFFVTGTRYARVKFDLEGNPFIYLLPGERLSARVGVTQANNVIRYVASGHKFERTA